MPKNMRGSITRAEYYSKYKVIKKTLERLMWQYGISVEYAVAEAKRVLGDSNNKPKFTWPTKEKGLNAEVFRYYEDLNDAQITAANIDAFFPEWKINAVSKLVRLGEFSPSKAFEQIANKSKSAVLALTEKLIEDIAFYKETIYQIMVDHPDMSIHEAKKEIHNVIAGKYPRYSQDAYVANILKKAKCDGFNMDYTQYLFEGMSPAKTKIEEKVWATHLLNVDDKYISEELVRGAYYISGINMQERERIANWILDASINKKEQNRYDNMTQTLSDALHQAKTYQQAQKIMDTTYTSIVNWLKNQTSAPKPYDVVENLYGKANKTGRTLLSTASASNEIILNLFKTEKFFTDEQIQSLFDSLSARQLQRLTSVTVVQALHQLFFSCEYTLEQIPDVLDTLSDEEITQAAEITAGQMQGLENAINLAMRGLPKDAAEPEEHPNFDQVIREFSDVLNGHEPSYTLVLPSVSNDYNITDLHLKLLSPTLKSRVIIREAQRKAELMRQRETDKQQYLETALDRWNQIECPAREIPAVLAAGESNELSDSDYDDISMAEMDFSRIDLPGTLEAPPLSSMLNDLSLAYLLPPVIVTVAVAATILHMTKPRFLAPLGRFMSACKASFFSPSKPETRLEQDQKQQVADNKVKSSV